MTQRPSAPTERARACPFVAFEDDRDMRSDRPDHRHRCFAEQRPAPRAIAHQEAFCLSSTFPACPTFQDWARREAAQARGATGGPTAAIGAVPGAPTGGPTASTGAVPGAVPAGGSTGGVPAGASDVPSGLSETDDVDDVPERGQPDDDPSRVESRVSDPDGPDDRAGDPGYEPPEPGWQPDDMPARNAARGWAAPPPWVGGPAERGPSGSPRSSGSDPLDPHERPAGGLASSRWLADVKPGDELDVDEDEAPPRGSNPSDRLPDPGSSASATPAFLAGRAAANDPADAEPDRELAALVSRTRPAGSPVRRNPRPMAGQQRPSRRQQPPRDDVGPSWERPRRFEAYPTLKTRIGMPAVPRIAVAVLALLVAAILLFMIPALFFGKPDPGSSASPSTSIAPSVSFVASTAPAPTATTYTILKGDNLGKIAKKFGVTTAQILTANPQIKDPNKIKVGDVIVIPTSIPSEIIDSTSPSASAGASGSSAP